MPSPSDVRSALGRLIASPAFVKSVQLTHFITYVVDEALAGRGERIKAYTIAIMALGRGDTFDPQIDPIVRVEAGRLRRALGHYYSGPGRHDPVVIDLPVGHYAPVFRYNGHGQGLMRRLHDIRGRLAHAWPTDPRLVITMIVIAGVVSVALDLAAMLFTYASRPALNAQSVPPAISTLPPPDVIRR